MKKIFEKFLEFIWNLFAARFTVWEIVLLGAAVRVLYYCHVAMISRDSVHYLDKVQLWIDGGSFESVIAYESCTLPLLGIKFFAHLFGSLLLGGVIFNLVASIALLIALYALLFQLTSSRLIANVGTFLMAFNPYLIELSFEIQRENLYLLMGTLWLFFLFRGLQGKLWSFALSGFFFCMAVNSRFEAFEFVLMTLAVVLFLAKLSVKEKGMALGFYLLGAFGGVAIMAILGVPVEYMKESGIKRIVSFFKMFRLFFH